MTLKTDGFFVLSGGFDEAGFAQSLAGMTVQVRADGASKPFSLLDCHDQALRASGRMLIEIGRTLKLWDNDGKAHVQTCKAAGRFVQDLPSGAVRAALKGFPELRALMEIGSGELRANSFAVLDELEKTQVRGSLTSLTSASGQATILMVQRLRGYDRTYAKVCAALEGMSTFGGTFEAAYQGLFPGMEPYKAKPDIQLGKSEPSIEVAADIIRTYLSVARQNEDGVLADIDTEFLHDYRVSLRRIRSVISLFKGVFSDTQTTELKQVFSDLMAPTGRVRDLDVYLLEKDRYYSLLPPNLHAGLKAMFDRFEKERKQELSRLSRRLRSTDYDKTMRELDSLFHGTDGLRPGPNAERGAYEYACALIWKRYRKVCKLARSISDDTPDQAVHDLRIDCKKLRYLMEFFSPLFDAKGFKSIIKPLKKLQDNLGLFNDFSVQQEALLSFVSRESNAQDRVDAQIGLAAGGLIAVLDQRQTAERSRVIANFQQFDSPDIRHLFRSLFHHKEG